MRFNGGASGPRAVSEWHRQPVRLFLPGMSDWLYRLQKSLGAARPTKDKISTHGRKGSAQPSNIPTDCIAMSTTKTETRDT